MQQCRLLYAVLGAGTLSRKLLLPPLWRGEIARTCAMARLPLVECAMTTG